ncbi:MAG: Holliday junction branch migration DNA helicase RuvB [Patescibacteria group bacterium]
MNNNPLHGPDPIVSNEDQSMDSALRPRAWEEYVGQGKAKENLRIIIDAARKRGEAMDHVLFSGPAGLGKTTLAYLVARELGANVRTTSGPALEKMGDMAAILTNLEPHEILFIDEAHRINRLIEEVLYPAMESRKLHLMIGKGPSARSLTIDLPPFTLIAATTRENLLSQPLRSRFGAIFRLEYYGENDIQKILSRSSEILKIAVSKEGVNVLARASRSTPRVANRILKRARDFMEVQGKKEIDEGVAKQTLDLLEIDEVGLEQHDRKLLNAIIEKFGGGPVGIGTLAAALSEERGVIEDIYEPYLMSLGFLQRTPSGRVVLPAAYDHLGTKRKGGLL